MLIGLNGKEQELPSNSQKELALLEDGWKEWKNILVLAL